MPPSKSRESQRGRNKKMVQCQRKFEISSDQLTSNYHFLEKENLNEGFNHFQFKRPLVVSFSHEKQKRPKAGLISREDKRECTLRVKKMQTCRIR